MWPQHPTSSDMPEIMPAPANATCHSFAGPLESHERLVDIRGFQRLNLRRDVSISCSDRDAALTPNTHAISIP